MSEDLDRDQDQLSEIEAKKYIKRRIKRGITDLALFKKDLELLIKQISEWPTGKEMTESDVKKMRYGDVVLFVLFNWKPDQGDSKNVEDLAHNFESFNRVLSWTLEVVNKMLKNRRVIIWMRIKTEIKKCLS